MPLFVVVVSIEIKSLHLRHHLVAEEILIELVVVALYYYCLALIHLRKNTNSSIKYFQFSLTYYNSSCSSTPIIFLRIWNFFESSSRINLTQQSRIHSRIIQMRKKIKNQFSLLMTMRPNRTKNLTVWYNLDGWTVKQNVLD